MSGVGITYLWTKKEFPDFIRLEGKRGDYEVYVRRETCHDTGMRHPGWTCSCCGYEANYATSYCPGCGAEVEE